ncbi:MAG: hypothetical protein WC994_09770 [Brumimicrobium sp.]
MYHNIISYNEAYYSKGFDFSGYTYDFDLIPVGNFNATLNLKLWSKRTPGIDLYFSNNILKIILTVYHNKYTDDYTIDTCLTNFKTCPLNKVYNITIGVNSKGRKVTRYITRSPN